eukprot:551089-Alexandrium_andersonii.AAC.1
MGKANGRTPWKGQPSAGIRPPPSRPREREELRRGGVQAAGGAPVLGDGGGLGGDTSQGADSSCLGSSMGGAS